MFFISVHLQEEKAAKKEFDFDAARDKLLQAKSFDQKFAAAKEICNFCLSLGKDDANKLKVESSANLIIQSVFSIYDDGINLQLVKELDDPESAAKLLSLAYKAASNFPQLQSDILIYIRSFGTDFGDDEFVKATLKEFESLINLSLVSPKKQNLPNDHTQEDAEPDKSQINPTLLAPSNSETLPKGYAQPAATNEVNEPVTPIELKPSDVSPYVSELNALEYDRVFNAAKEISKIVGASVDQNFTFEYAKKIIDRVFLIDSGRLEILVGGKDKNEISGRIQELYWLAFLCVSSSPDGMKKLFEYITKKNEDAINYHLNKKKDQVRFICSSITSFCTAVLLDNNLGPTVQENPQLLGYMLQTLVVAGAQGIYATGEINPNKYSREHAIGVLEGLLSSDNPSVVLLVSRALRLFAHRNDLEKKQIVSDIVNSLSTHYSSWNINDSILILEEALRLDSEISSKSSRIISNENFSNFLKNSNPILLIHALMVSCGLLGPMDSLLSNSRQDAQIYDVEGAGKLLDLSKEKILGMINSNDNTLSSFVTIDDYMQKYQNKRQTLYMLYLNVLSDIARIPSNNMSKVSAEAASILKILIEK